mmetsp:Transcript_50028/g.57588  ORF Transcript_50028/g.57588 Transcript_50028/m.57588 type:complete len:90 (+) Transcript_50028:29-298(+)
MEKMQPCKFIFETFSKYIEMDIQKRAILDDMKVSFGKILGINLFAKKLVYYLGDSLTPLDSSKPLLEAISTLQQNAQIQLLVKITEIGA